jgi:hypothetical protein
MSNRRSPPGGGPDGLDRKIEVSTSHTNLSKLFKPNPVAVAAIATALKLFPELYVGGLDLAGPEIRARSFLNLCRKQPAPTSSSYHLKHVAEQCGPSAGMCSYVGNAAMIAAAVSPEFVVRPIEDTPNAGNLTDHFESVTNGSMRAIVPAVGGLS